jgi:hypothetical protein
VIPAIDIDMLIPGWPDMREVVLVDRIALPFELFNRFRHVHGIP